MSSQMEINHAEKFKAMLQNDKMYIKLKIKVLNGTFLTPLSESFYSEVISS
jgi:hypothetical protein